MENMNLHVARELRAEADVPSPEPLTNLFVAKAKKNASEVAAYSKVDGRWSSMTWSEVQTAVEELSLGLLELGAKRGDRIGIVSNTRREWAQADMSILFMGGVTIGVYPTLTRDETKYLLKHSGARIVFVEDGAQRVKVSEATEDFAEPVHIVTFEAEAEAKNVITYAELRRRGAKRRLENPDEVARRLAENKTTDVVTYVYTSGTTGEPKGAMLTHANFHYVIHASAKVMPYDGEVSLGFLPLAHSLQRYASYLGLIVDVEGYYAESLDTIAENIREVRPTCFATVPRVLEKIHAKVLSKAEEAGGWKTDVFHRSMAALAAVGDARRAGEEPGFRARARARIADRLVGEKIRGRLGGRVKWLGCGGAPLAQDVQAFFENLGIAILEGYGLTETSAPVCINTLANRRMGTVGRPLPGTHVKIASDGEILVRGPGIFAGYFENPEASKAAFDDDGWFKTGDVGHMSRDGFLSITDRKKDLIITAGGKNIAPQKIEALLKRDPVVGQAVVIGDRRPYLTALIGVDAEAREFLEEAYGVSKDAPIADAPEVQAAIEKHVATVNRTLPRFEQIKKWTLLPGEMTVESGELTPTLKVKRRIVHERYSDSIDGLYS